MTDFDDTKAPPQNDEPEEDFGEIIGNCAVIPPGEYVVRYMYHATGHFRDQPKVTVYCGVIAPDDWASTELERFYNVESLKGPPRRFGGFPAPARGDLCREMSILLGPFERRDRLTPARLRGKRILCEVETVTHDRDRRSLPPDQHYSRIKRFIRILPDEDW